jgi:FKBP-type peptidyl-prolyl cis-trans isomerase
MKNIYKYIFLAASAIIPASCARIISEGVNEAEQRYFNAWLKVNGISESQKAGRGIYILEKTETASGTTVGADGYAIVEYTTTDLEGNITDYTDMEQAKQLGTYSPGSYYGPKVWTTTAETIRAGLYDGIAGMKIDERRRFIVPSWLMSYKNLATEAEYLAVSSDNSTTIFDVTVKDFTKDINQWQFSKILQTINNKDFYDGAFNGTNIEDTTGVAYGMFYKTLEGIEEEKAFEEDTTIYINYTGKLLNGLIFDTNVERIAKDNHIYSASRTYGPTAVQWGESWSEITLDGSEVIGGFSRTLWQMAKLRKGSKGVGIFYSELGYGYSGSSNIPGYAPLIFEIEFVDKPEEM